MIQKSLILLFSFSLLILCIIPVYAQTSTNHIVINEFDTNPPGDDSGAFTDWVELYNPTDSAVDIGSWQIISVTLNNAFTIPHNTVIEPGKFLIFSHVRGWFDDMNEIVELRDNNNILIDNTPLLSDMHNNSLSWQRGLDGHDLDSVDDWRFALSTMGSSNMISETSNSLTMLITSDKTEYVFGENAVISGSIFEDTSASSAYESILLTISGSDYTSSELLFPDKNGNFGTTISLNEVLGINAGTYTVSGSYSGATAQTTFTVDRDDKSDTTPIGTGTLSISINKSEYLPGETLTINASTNKTIPFEGLKFQITDPEDAVIASGSLFPTNGQFSTSVFLNTIDPIYGTYDLSGTYLDQSSTVTFDIIPDIKDDTLISLNTDKEVYGLGELVTITGRLNTHWAGSLDIEILQTENIALHTDNAIGRVLKILDVVNPQGDGRFEYVFTIPDSDKRLGTYWVKISESIGFETTSFIVSEDPDQHIVEDGPITILTDKTTYALGEMMRVIGKISNPAYRTSEVAPVKLTLSNDGSTVEILRQKSGAKSVSTGIPVEVEFTTIPDQSGRFAFDILIPRTTFTTGDYALDVTYRDISKSVLVEFVDTFVSQEASISINKEVYGLDETVYLVGTLPARAENTVFISVTKPDGKIFNSGTNVDNQQFTWQWQTPTSAGYQPLKGTEDRSVIASNLGIYKIYISSGTFNQTILFKVSENPEEDELVRNQLVVGSEKPVYTIGEKLRVIGSVSEREFDVEGIVIPDRVRIVVLTGQSPPKQIHEAFVYPQQGGYFESVFDLPLTLFKEGEHTIRAYYTTLSAEAKFNVSNELDFDNTDDVVLLLSTDKSIYNPGDVVTVTGKPSRIVHVEQFEISMIQKSENDVSCGSYTCGIHTGPITRLEPSPLNSFTHQYTIEDSPSSIGAYEITVDAGFEAKSITFAVLSPSETINTPEPISFTIIEKTNRIPDSVINIITGDKLSEDNLVMKPRVLIGSLVTAPADQSAVNLMVTSESGVCVIGPNPDCLVRESTRKAGTIFDVVEVDGITVLVRYSGPDVRLEKFNIVPQDTMEFLPATNWKVDILKDDQPSRFYYKINYQITQ